MSTRLLKFMYSEGELGFDKQPTRCQRLSKEVKRWLGQDSEWLFVNDIRSIEARFGATIASYFVFARSLFALNVTVAVVWWIALILPWVNSFQSPTYMQNFWPELNT